MEYEVVHLPERERYELRQRDATIGYLAATARGGTLLMPYIEIEPAHRGRNLSSVLLRRALEDVRSRGLKVMPLCPVVGAFLRRNEAFRDLVAA
ncbi:MAG TPA: GNAT family N-acetyltransferase [Fimbriimonas sp.]|nr:GNAT family N-acetyltransferase [Fimbriimonas sp.]